MNWLPRCAVALVILRLLAQLALESLNRAEVRRRAGRCPAPVEGVMDAATYARSGQYTLAKSRLGSLETACDSAVLLAVLFSGVLPWLWARVNGLSAGAAWSGALFIAAVAILLGLSRLPWEWWSQFRLEAGFGFNKSTQGLWAADQLKVLLLGLAVGLPVVWALLKLAAWTGPWWWVWGFALLFGVQMLMIVIYPKLILPLFNRLSPLPDGEQRASLLDLARHTGFQAQTIEVMDGSKRSGHSNAFFTGFGRFRHIVLFDTLMAQLSPAELEAVLAHEIGHYKRGHVPRYIALSGLLQFGAFAAAAWLARAPWFSAAFGLPENCLAPTLLLAGLLGGVVTFWFAPALSWLSRRHEFEADRFARDAIGSGAPLIGALRKLSQENLSNLTPHPLYSMVYYSHPTLVERERALRR